MVNASDRHPRYFAVIVAAGKGTRFGADVPKQFLPLCGKPVLCRSIDAFRACPDTEVVLVLSDTGRDMWLDLCRLHCIDSPRIVIGGDSRSESVHNALRAIAPELTTESVVMVHDGARPMLTPGFISRIAREFDRPDVDSAVPVMPLTESLCMADGDAAVRPVDRSLYRSVQTPQAFRAIPLLEAYDALDGSVMSDDASIFAAYTGRPVHTVAGLENNIKITHPRDLDIAGVLLRH